MRKWRLFVITILAVLLLTSCSRTVREVVIETEDESYYRNHAGSEQITEQIEESFQSVKRIQHTVFYRTYHFDPEDPPLRDQLRGVSLEGNALRTSTDSHSTMGTAVALTQSGNEFMLLTASHVVTSPDTLWHEVQATEPTSNQQIEAVSVIDRNSYLLFGVGTVVPFEVAVNDDRRDLALLFTRAGSDEMTDIQPLSIQTGNSSELGWADIVYTVGFPKGIQMVNSGIVSRTDIRRRGGFTVDASFNRGFSGGVIFAIRGNQPVLEWVGMLNSVSADTEYILTPGDMTIEEYQPDIPFRDSVYVERMTRINYGIGFAIGLSDIENFFQEHSAEITDAGFPLPDF